MPHETIRPLAVSTRHCASSKFRRGSVARDGSSLSTRVHPWNHAFWVRHGWSTIPTRHDDRITSGVPRT